MAVSILFPYLISYCSFIFLLVFVLRRVVFWTEERLIDLLGQIIGPQESDELESHETGASVYISIFSSACAACLWFLLFLVEYIPNISNKYIFKGVLGPGTCLILFGALFWPLLWSQNPKILVLDPKYRILAVFDIFYNLEDLHFLS